MPYYHRFLERFPDVGTLARARESSVLALWSGLGYYRRARMLHRAAKVAARDGLPAGYDGWRALPGIGDYTAAAIASIAHGEPTPVVDGNVERVVSRYLARHLSRKQTRDAMAGWIPDDEPGDFNQAVMELGATVCLPRNPRCDACPLRDDCRGRDRCATFPAPRARPKPRDVRRAVKLATRDGRVFLRRDDALLEGMWDLPPSRGGGRPLGEVRHAIVDRLYRITIHVGRATGEGRWFTPAQVRRIPLATSARKCLSEVGFLPA